MLTKAIGIGAVGLAILAGALALRLDASEAKADKAQAEAKSERTARIATEAELISAEHIASKTKDALDEAHQATETARLDALRARRAGDSLRQYAATLASAASQDPAPASPGPSAGQAAAMLADMLGRCSEAHGELAEFADRAHAAGTACERISDAVTQ